MSFDLITLNPDGSIREYITTNGVNDDFIFDILKFQFNLYCRAYNNQIILFEGAYYSVWTIKWKNQQSDSRGDKQCQCNTTMASRYFNKWSHVMNNIMPGITAHFYDTHTNTNSFIGPIIIAKMGPTKSIGKDGHIIVTSCYMKMDMDDPIRCM